MFGAKRSINKRERQNRFMPNATSARMYIAVPFGSEDVMNQIESAMSFKFIALGRDHHNQATSIKRNTAQQPPPQGT